MRAITAVIGLVFSYGAIGQGGVLPRSSPESQGVSSSAVLAFIEAADQNIDALHSVMILRHGQVVAEGFWAPYGPDSPHSLYSLSKSFTSTAVGLAIAEGKLSLDDEVLKFFPEDAPESPSGTLQSMRVSDLLRMSTGHQSEPRFNPQVPWTKTFLAHEVPFKPGTHFLYNTPATYMLSAIVQKATGTTVLDYLRPRLFDPLGITNPTWEKSPQGITTGGYGLSIRTEDIAKFGQLLLQKGKWGETQLVPAAWVEAATARQTANGSNPNSDWDQGYGYQFWRARHGAFRSDGAFGQYCLVLPEQDAVIAITSGVRDMQSVLNLVWDKLLPGFRDEPGPLDDDEDSRSKLMAKLRSLSLPPVDGKHPSNMAQGQIFHFPPNARKLETLALEAAEHLGPTIIRTKSDGVVSHVVCRSGSWEKSRMAWGGFPEQPVAATGGWTEPEEFTAKLCFYETPFVVTLRFKLDGEELRLRSETNVGFGPTRQSELVGTTSPVAAERQAAAPREDEKDLTGPARWNEEIEAFEAADRSNPPRKGGVLFTGSSTIRLWETLAEDFPSHQVKNRGFGGCEIADVTHFAERIIFPHEPAQIVLRAGGNDIHNGKLPEQVARDFAAFVQKVRERLPSAEITYIAVSPAPARWGENDKYRALNARIREMALSMPRVSVVETFDMTIGSNGQARTDLFVEDRLHLSAAGYQLLAERVRPFLIPPK